MTPSIPEDQQVDRGPIRIAPREAAVGDLVQRMHRTQSGLLAPHPTASAERIVSAGPKRLICEYTSGPLRGQRIYRTRDNLEILHSVYRVLRLAEEPADA
jgi:hypothetical protein